MFLIMRNVKNTSVLTKKRISDAMKLHHQKRGTIAREKTAQLQSDSMKNYWDSMGKTPSKNEENSLI